MLLDQAVWESRKAMAAPLESAVQVSQLEERILMSASPLAVVANAPDALAVQPADSGTALVLSDQQLLDVVADSVLTAREPTALAQWHSLWLLYDIWFIILSLRLHGLC
jgi:hypothetical protein